MNLAKPTAKHLRRAALVCAAFLTTACVGVGISIPVGPFGSIGLGVNGNGQVSALIGLGGHVGSVGVSTGVALPLGNAANPQTGSSQNVPRY